jgi:hypothetical protein
MKDSGMNRWMGFIGLATVVAFFLGFGAFGGGGPSENASGVSVAHWYNTHSAMSWASIYLVGLGLALLLIFTTQMRTVLLASGSKGPWANAAFGAGIIFVAGVVVLGTFQITLILAAHNHEYAIAKTVYFFSQNNELVLLFGVCMLTLTTGLAILLGRSPASLPKTLGWYSVVVAVVAAAGPFSLFSVAFGFPIWLIATGFVVATKQRRGTLSPSSSNAATAASSSSASQLVTA